MKDFTKLEEALEDFSKGKMLVVVDDEDRENEGDLVMAAQCLSSVDVNFMAKYGKGLICTPISTKIAKKLNLDLMVRNNGSIHETAFTVSIDAVGTGTGISAVDRAKTVRALTNEFARAEDFLRPGHIFPLIARDGGVLERAGHTEAAIDLCKLAGFNEVGVICEIINDDGTMARGESLDRFCKEHDLKILAIDELKAYIDFKNTLFSKSTVIDLPTTYGDFKLHLFENKNGEHHLAFTNSDFIKTEEVLTRVHSECLTGDLFGSKRCDCGDQLHIALKKIKDENGILIYLRQEGRGIGLANKIKAYKLQDKGFDTVSANHELGFEADLRDFKAAADILKDFGVKSVRLLTNNNEKVKSLASLGIEIKERLSLESEPNQHNLEYLKTKKEKMGHFLMKTIR